MLNESTLGSFRGFISISISSVYHFKQQSESKTNIQVNQPPFLRLSLIQQSPPNDIKGK